MPHRAGEWGAEGRGTFENTDFGIDSLQIYLWTSQNKRSPNESKSSPGEVCKAQDEPEKGSSGTHKDPKWAKSEGHWGGEKEGGVSA